MHNSTSEHFCVALLLLRTFVAFINKIIVIVIVISIMWNVSRKTAVRKPQVTFLLPTVKTANMLPCPQGPELHSRVSRITQQRKEWRK